ASWRSSSCVPTWRRRRARTSTSSNSMTTSCNTDLRLSRSCAARCCTTIRRCCEGLAGPRSACGAVRFAQQLVKMMHAVLALRVQASRAIRPGLEAALHGLAHVDVLALDQMAEGVVAGVA